VPVIVLAWKYHQNNRPLAGLLTIYAALASGAQLIDVAGHMGLLSGLDTEALLRLDLYTTLILAAILMGMVTAFFENRYPGWSLPVAFVAIAGLTLLTSALGDAYLRVAATLMWVTLTLWTIVMVLNAVPIIRDVEIRNRLNFFLPVFLFLIANDLILLNSTTHWGNSMRVGGVMLLAYFVLKDQLPDSRDVMRRTLIYVITTILVLVVYVIGFIFSRFAFRAVPGYDPLLFGALIALVLAFLFAPLNGLVRQVIDRIFQREHFDIAQTLRSYSISISNVLDLELLATVSVGVVIEALEINRGFIFRVDRELTDEKTPVYRLRGVRGAGDRPATDGTIANDSPFGQAMDAGRRAILQYELDNLPEFKSMQNSERLWLHSMGTEVYVPIYSQNEWIGMMALGPKTSKNRYSSDDLDFLATLASQTAVALQNARLVENLMAMNNQLSQAYQALGNANRTLEKLDQTKSNFISIASHELRTPLTVMRGYTEMLMDTPTITDDASLKMIVKGIHDGTLRLHEIMDSMFDIAQLDNREMQLHTQDVFLADVLRNVTNEQASLAFKREQEITLDLPPLPSIKADPNLLVKVFNHLVVNAIKFTPNKGKITISGKHIPRNNSDLPEGGVEIIVSDTGVGVDPEYSEIIFTKFYQPGDLIRHSTGRTKFKGNGAGLGLTLAKGIVEAHGGRIWVESAGYDETNMPGSDFHVVLPVRSLGESSTVRMGSAVKLKL
jgi:signal transduction histidine kinase